RARVTTGQRDGVFLLPQMAISSSDQGRFVYVVNEQNQATIRPVVVGDWVGKDWVVLEGLSAGDKVIVDNIIKLRPGASVAPSIAGAKPEGVQPPATKESVPEKSSGILPTKQA